MYSKIAIVSALAALTSTVAAGTAKVQNHCGYDAYLWSVADSADVQMQTLSGGSGSYSEAFRTNPDGGGISLKIATNDSQAVITQFEYTLSSGDVYYDLSNINGNPFESGGVTLTPSDTSCVSVTCVAGVELCEGAYNQPDDNQATQGCGDSTDLTLVLCPGGAATSGVSSSATASATSSASSASPTTLATSTTAAASSASPSATTEDFYQRHAHNAHHRRAAYRA